jgi:hypothetical protein
VFVEGQPPSSFCIPPTSKYAREIALIKAGMRITISMLEDRQSDGDGNTNYALIGSVSHSHHVAWLS